MNAYNNELSLYDHLHSDRVDELASAAILAPLFSLGHFESSLHGAIGTPKEDADAESGSERTAWNVVTRALKAVV